MKLTLAMSVLTTTIAAASLRTVSAFVPSHVSTRAAVGATSATTSLALFDKLFSTGAESSTGKLPILADEAVMSQKAHGTSEKPVQSKLRWNCDVSTADRICNFNRHYAEVRLFERTIETESFALGVIVVTKT